MNAKISIENCQIFLENERKMARAYGVEHLYYLKSINGNNVPFQLLPSKTTLFNCISSLEEFLQNAEISLPSEKTFRAITAFFKEAYQLNLADAIDDRTLLNYPMDDILAKQGLTDLKKREISPMPQDWFEGLYYCYYEQYSAAKDSGENLCPLEMKGAILRVFPFGKQTYKAIMMFGFSDKENMDLAYQKIFSKSNKEKSIYLSYENYLKQKPDSERSFSFWTGNIKECSNQTNGDFHRWPIGKEELDNQEIVLTLFKYPKSDYNNCQGGAGIMVTITHTELWSSKFLFSKNPLKWHVVSYFFSKRHSRPSMFRQDDKDFLNIIRASEN